MSTRNMRRTEAGHLVPRAIYAIIEQPDGDLIDQSTKEMLAAELLDQFKNTGMKVIRHTYVPRDEKMVALEDVRQWIRDGVYPSLEANAMLLDVFNQRFGK